MTKETDRNEKWKRKEKKKSRVVTESSSTTREKWAKVKEKEKDRTSPTEKEKESLRQTIRLHTTAHGVTNVRVRRTTQQSVGADDELTLNVTIPSDRR